MLNIVIILLILSKIKKQLSMRKYLNILKNILILKNQLTLYCLIVLNLQLTVFTTWSNIDEFVNSVCKKLRIPYCLNRKIMIFTVVLA